MSAFLLHPVGVETWFNGESAALTLNQPVDQIFGM